VVGVGAGEGDGADDGAADEAEPRGGKSSFIFEMNVDGYGVPTAVRTGVSVGKTIRCGRGDERGRIYTEK